MIFNQARGIARKFAFVHIASAKFELETLGKSSMYHVHSSYTRVKSGILRQDS